MKCSNCGKEIAEDSVFCEYCGTRVKNGTETPSSNLEEASFIQKLGSFLIPIIGLIIYLINVKARPIMAKQCLKMAIWGFVVGVVLEVIIALA